MKSKQNKLIQVAQSPGRAKPCRGNPAEEKARPATKPGSQRSPRGHPAGARRLGADHANPANRPFGQFVAETARKGFGIFLRKVFADQATETCEMAFPPEQDHGPSTEAFGAGSALGQVRITAAATDYAQVCRSAVMDVIERKPTQKAMQTLLNSVQQENERLYSLINNIGDEVWFAGTDRKFTLINASGRQAFNLASAAAVDVEHLARSVEIFRPDGSPRPLEEAPPLRALVGETVRNQEEIVRLPATGQLRHREVNASPVMDARGGIVGAVCVVHDITVRRFAEERHSTILQAAMDGFWVMNEQGRLLEVNEALCQMTGFSRLELLDMSLLKLNRNDTPENAAARTQRIKRAGKERLESQIWRADGGRIDVELSVTYIGEPSNLFFIFARDITARKVAVESLRASEERFRTLVDAITDYAYTATVQDGEVVATVHGPGCMAVTGYAPEEFRANPSLWFQMVHPEDQPRALAWAARLALDQKTQPMEHRLIHKDGSIRWVRSSAVLRHDNLGRYVGYEGLIQDITECKRLQDQLIQAQKMEAVGQLAGGVAHDFRNQLTVIKGYAEMLQRRGLVNEEGQSPLNHILNAADRSATITEQLLAFSRQQTLRPTAADVGVLASDMMKSLVQTLGEDIRPSVKPRRDLWPVRVDTGQFQQALLNLVLNARDAMPKGGQLTIETENVVLGEDFVRAHVGTSAGRYVVLTVSDTGVGMSAETLRHLFEPFFTTKPVGEGTGLGLAMIHGFVAQSGGFSDVQSQLGHGTTFRLYFPAVDDVVRTTAPLAPAPSMPGGSGTVLVVEDEEEILRILLETLTECGYTVLAAGDGREAKALIDSAQNQIDLLITDVVMPGESGPELAQHFRAARPGAPVLMISGYTGKMLTGHGVASLEADLLVKPFSSQELAETVWRILGQPAPK